MSAYDYGRWGEWHQRVFPTLEATLLAAGLSRTLGIVCFHPCYLTPDRRVLLSALECSCVLLRALACSCVLLRALECS